MSKRQGRKSAAQTPSPSVDRVFGSKTNKEGSASSSKSAESIKLSQKILDTLKEKAKKYNDTHKKDVSLNTLKAVFRRGSGAYSTSHRPTITGGAPNSRNAWSFARVNKFLEKKGGKPVKKAYVQDDDLLENGGETKSIFYDGLIIGNDGIYRKTNNLDMELTQSLTISDIDNKYPQVSHPYINKQVINGIKVEMEHTNDPETAKKIALDHLFESIHYYEELEKMEKTLEKREMDEHYNEIKDIYENGGEIDEIFHFTTPTGERSKLTYIQQVLVRTSAFKNWFGDWEKAAKRFLSDGRENYDKHYERVSKVIDSVTLEPRVVYHGTMSEKEFFTFDVTREKGTGRPYSYFAYNKEYAQHFTKVSQREGENAQPHLYEVFLDVKHPFIAQGHEYVDKDKDGEGWLKAITGTIMWDRYRTIERDDFARAVESTIENQVGRYVKNIYPSGTKNKFWKLMAGDVDKQFKFFLLAYDFDGVFYSEEFATDYDVENPAQFTLAITVFDAHQIKLADGRNTQFNPFSDDIRFEKGGNLHENEHEVEVEHTQKLNKLESIHQMMEKGGKVQGDGKKSNDAKDGGYFVGKSHADGGIKAHNTDTGQIIEVEGNEVIINKRSVADETKREFEGEMLTNREILSRINEAGGGVSFADGGEIKYNCGCNKKTYNFGGELLEESIIVNRINNVADPIVESKSYLDNLMDNIYG